MSEKTFHTAQHLSAFGEIVGDFYEQPGNALFCVLMEDLPECHHLNLSCTGQQANVFLAVADAMATLLVDNAPDRRTALKAAKTFVKVFSRRMKKNLDEKEQGGGTP